MWCLTAPGIVVHRIRDDKSAATMTALVGNYHGVIVCDAASTHEAGARDGPGITLAACWAHYPDRATARTDEVGLLVGFEFATTDWTFRGKMNN